jgi:ubiquinone/menaquinone biosynthesis C-methylase UbiE
MSVYQLDHQWHKERARLASLEALADPFTIECLEKIGIQPGWQCLEVGAGGGSMTAWLCQRVGAQGRVVAIDLETKFLETLQEPNLEIRQQDIVKDELEAHTFDLVYARAVLEHLPTRDTVLDKLIQALKPNGWLLIISGDYISFASVDPRTAQRFERGYRAFFHLFEVAGVDLYYGRRVASAIRERNITDVQMHGYVTEWGGTRPATQTWTYLFERVREKVIAANLLTKEEVDEFLQLVNAPDFTALTLTFCGAWGRKSNYTGT